MHVFGLVAGVAIEIAATLKFIVWNRFDFCLLNDRVIFKQCHLSYTSILLLWNEYLNYMNFWLKEKKQLNQWMNSMISKSCLVFWLVCTSHHFGAEGESVAFNVCWIAHTASFVPFVVQRQLESWFRGESEDWSYRCWLRAFGQTNIGKELPAWGNFELRCGSSLLQVALDCHCSLAYSTRATFWSYTILFLPFVVQRQLESWFRGESEDWSYRCWLRAFGQTNIGKELPAWGNFELRCGSSLLQVALDCHCSLAYSTRAIFWSYTILVCYQGTLCCYWCWVRCLQHHRSKVSLVAIAVLLQRKGYFLVIHDPLLKPGALCYADADLAWALRSALGCHCSFAMAQGLSHLK